MIDLNPKFLLTGDDFNTSIKTLRLEEHKIGQSQTPKLSV